MKKKKIHYICLLANVDESILKLNDILKHGFEIKEFDFMDEEYQILHKLEGMNHEVSLWSKFIYDYGCVGNKWKAYCIRNSFDVTINENEDNGFVINHEFASKEDKLIIREYIDSVTKKMKLFKEGNLHMPVEYQYFEIRHDKLQIALRRRFLDTSFGQFIIEESDLVIIKDLIKNIEMPFKFEKSFLQLAFENFELSYIATTHYKLRFLLLIMSLEVLFKSNKGCMTHCISGNIASYLGKDESSFKKIYCRMRHLYKIRSNIVHEGDSDLNSSQIINLINELRQYVRTALLEIDETNMDKSEFKKYLQNEYKKIDCKLQ